MSSLSFLLIFLFQVETPDQIMALPNDLVKDLDTRIIRSMSGDEKLQVIKQLISSGGSNLPIAYDGPGTQTVAETWHNKRANCLSMTFLIVAMARHVGLESRFHNYLDLDLYTENEEEVFYNLHMVAFIKTRPESWVQQDFARTGNPPPGGIYQDVSDELAIAQFYNNKAADALTQQNWKLAQQYLDSAIRIAPNYIASWRNSGVLFTRMGRFEAASYAYQEALVLNPDDELTWFNLAMLFQRWGKGEEQFFAQKKVEKVRASNPFYQNGKAWEAIHHGDYKKAETFARRALHLNKKHPVFHHTYAVVLFHLNKEEKAMSELELAAKYSQNSEQEQLFRDKQAYLARLGD
ncbi:MAG: tetratricopeptide repeat protein [Acidobacteria bacterium]|nr:tetratricopeptide repeat protein [Acidobacteriota bacterium]MCB9397896.1 tetratricopeptide repeat protein [Acidobacteriota bacterium]